MPSEADLVDEVVLLTPRERAEVFLETAARKSISSAVAMEKDFWVCWILRRAFEPPLVEGMVFKGGTSLSKAYGVIARFSEDIDLSLPRQAFGFDGDRDLAPGMSRAKRDRLLNDMHQACETHVRHPLKNELHSRISTALVGSARREKWELEPSDEEPATLLFTYPPALTPELYGAGAYIRPTVRLEFGGRNEVWPAESHAIRPYCTEVFPVLSARPDTAVNVLAAERTFWEKATLLHAEFHRPSRSRRSERVSRHYADLARLAQSDIGRRALERLDLLKAVAEHKRSYFPANWARYEEAAMGALRLVPERELEQVLRLDYLRMREMFFGDVEPFESIVETLQELEAAVNAATRDQ